MKTVFGLDYQTPAPWVGRVEREPLALLSDHAHCELQAAVSAQALIAKNTAHKALVEGLAEIAVEEMEHFELVVRELHQRGGTLATQIPNPYAEALIRGASRDRKHAFLDRLIIAALIEARSLERFHLLATHLADESLANLYKELVPSESSHHRFFIGHAREFFGSQAEEREEVLRAREGKIMASLPFCVRMHSGMS